MPSAEVSVAKAGDRANSLANKEGRGFYTPAFLVALKCPTKGSLKSHDEALRLLTEHRKELEALAGALLERETLDEEEILEVTGLPPAPPLENRKILISDTDSHM